MARQYRALAGAIGVALVLSACAADPLADQYRAGSGSGSGSNYIAGDGSVTENPAANRGAPVAFSGIGENGETINAADYAGKVMVVNFWYAGCAPCRAEAPDLLAVWEKYRDQQVQFIGVNVRDPAATAATFTQAFGITYPSILDASSGAVQLALSGTVAPNAVPTTLVLDRRGRVAARILGRISAASILETLITSALAEPGS